MVYWFLYQWKLSRLRRGRRRLQGRYQKKIEELTKNKTDRHEIDQLRYDQYDHLFEIDDIMQSLITRRLIKLAEDKLIPLPSSEPESMSWSRSVITNERHLLPLAAANLRAEIRKEQREGSELAFRWLSAFTGLIGALIGLIALLTKH